MISIKDIVNNKKLPTFIRNYNKLSSLKKVDKIFDRIGLSNFKEDAKVENILSGMKDAELLRVRLIELIELRVIAIKKFIPNHKVGKRRTEQIANILKYLCELKSALFYKDTSIIKDIANEKIIIVLSSDISNTKGNIIFRKNENVFVVLDTINSLLKENKFLILEYKNNNFYKNYINTHKLYNQYKVVFSSDGQDGVWDLATMSARGINSCQSWTTESFHKNKLLGSIVDPCAGIIYIESKDKNKNGTLMEYRCVVRLICQDEKTPVIMLEKLYPRHNDFILSIFEAVIKSKLTHNINIVYVNNGVAKYSIDCRKWFIPVSRFTKSLPETYRSYRDSHIPYNNKFSITKLNNLLKGRKNL